MKKNGFTLIELLSTILLLSLILVIAIPSFNFISSRLKQNMLQNKIKQIEISASSWASETGLLATNVEHLITSGFLEADNESGDYLNPVTNNSLKCNIVFIEKEEENFNAVFSEEQNCNYEEIASIFSIFEIKKYTVSNKPINDSTNGWTNESVWLELNLKEGYEQDINHITRIIMRGNNQTEERMIDKNFLSNNKFLINASILLNASYEFNITVKKEDKTYIYPVKTDVKIDIQRPTIYKSELNVDKNDEWTGKTKKVKFTMSDGSGSGIYGYSISKNSNCKTVSYTKTNKLNISRELSSGTYYICAKDKVGNLSEDISTNSFQIERVDTSGPIINVTPSTNWSRENSALIEAIDNESGVIAWNVTKTGATPSSWIGVNNTNKFTITKNDFITNGTYYAWAKDAVGNISKKSFQITKVDRNSPVITNFSIRSNNNYNSLSTTLTINASDVSKMQMCISNSNFETNCSWENYVTSKLWKLNGTLDGGRRTVYLTIRDEAGNKINRTVSYTVYKECGNNKSTTYSPYGACSKSCGGGLKYRTETTKDNLTGKVCTSIQRSQSCNEEPCEDPNDPNWSNKTACDANAFRRIVNNTSKFKSYIEYQAFRNAMYDCGHVTAGILYSSESAWTALRNSSRFTVVSGQGKNENCTCYYNKTSSSAERTCRKPACNYEHERFVSPTIYNGKVFVLSATTSQYLSGKYDDDGYGSYEDTGRTWDKWGYTSILMGSGNDIGEPIGWGSCNRDTNGIINYKVGCSEKSNRIAEYYPSLRVGLYKEYFWTYDADKNDRNINNYMNGKVYVAIFRI